MRCLAVFLVGLLVCGPGVPTGNAQAPVAGEGPPAITLSAQQLEELVGRIALYPDDLVAIILPASTFPLDVVQAERFLQKVKQDKNLKPDQRWDESIRNLLNYPEVISMMSQDVDWTQDLGEAVVSQQPDVLKAIQAFRAKAASAGNLKTDDKQIIVQEKETIQIVPADPEVIYVPQYQPTTVVVQQAAPPPPVYYPTPYPTYYYPYGAGAAMATGFFLGAATAYACNWGGGNIENNVNINNTQNMNMNRNNQQIQQKTNEARQRADQAQAQRGGQAGQAGRGQGQGAGQGGGQRWQSQKRPGEVSQGRVSPRTAEARPGYGGSGAPRGDAFGSAGRGSDATRDASRGMQSRSGSASTMERGGGQPGGGSLGGASASTMDKGGSRGGGGSASMGSGTRGGSGGGGGAGGGGGGRGGGGGGRRR
jgi:hypothetical protein